MIEYENVPRADRSIVSEAASMEINRHLDRIVRIARRSRPNRDNSPDVENISFEPQRHRRLTIDNQIMRLIELLSWLA